DRSSLIRDQCEMQMICAFGNQVWGSPSPFGRGCREAAGEGEKRPHPALFLMLALSGSRFARTTFSRREKDSPRKWFANLDSSAPKGQNTAMSIASKPRLAWL